MRTSRVAMLLAGLALALAGCGGDDETSPRSAGREGAVTRTEPGTGSVGRAGREGARHPGESRERADSGGLKPLTPAVRAAETDAVHALVRDLIESYNARDPSVCTRLFDRRLIEPAKRDEALAGCRRAVARQPSGLRVAEIEKVRFRQMKGRREAGVQFLVARPGRRTTRYAYHLIYEDGRYRIDRGIPVEQPGR